MKKIIFGILALTLLSGCSININTDKDNADVGNTEVKEDSNNTTITTDENYLLTNSTLLKKDIKEVTLNGNKHKLELVYSYGFTKDNQMEWFNVMYVTVLLDGKLIDPKLTNKHIYLDHYTDENSTRNNLATLENKLTKEEYNRKLNNTYISVDVVKDSSSDKQHIVLTIDGEQSWSGIVYSYIINQDGYLMKYDEQYTVYSIQDASGKYIVGNEDINGKSSEFVKTTANGFEMYHIGNGGSVYKSIYTISNEAASETIKSMDGYKGNDLGW